MVHVADLLCFFTGSPATEAKTVTSQVESPVVNSWNSAIYFENGATGTIRSNYATGGRVHTFELHNSQVSVYLLSYWLKSYSSSEMNIPWEA